MNQDIMLNLKEDACLVMPVRRLISAIVVVRSKHVKETLSFSKMESARIVLNSKSYNKGVVYVVVPV